MKFRKKPVVIEAYQFKYGPSIDEMYRAWGDEFKECSVFDDQVLELFIQTLEGQMRVTFGDWIIKGVKGEFYPCKPDIFEMTYEPA